MKLVALVRKPDGRHEVFEEHVNGTIVYCYSDDGEALHSLVEDNALTVDAPEDAAKEPEASTEPTDFHMTKAAVMDRLLGKDRDGIVIEKLEFFHEEPHPESAPSGEIIVFCKANYKVFPITANAKSHMNRDFIANYLEKLIWERLRNKKDKIDAAQN